MFEPGTPVLVKLPRSMGGTMFGVVVDRATHTHDEDGDPIPAEQVPVSHENGQGVWGCPTSWLEARR